MQQLWMGQQRIDSIEELQQLFVGDDIEYKCKDLLVLYRDRVLLHWLNRQPESVKNGLDDELYNAIKILKNNSEVCKDVITALICLTKVNKDTFENIYMKVYDTISNDELDAVREKKLHLFFEQSWWNNNNNYQEIFKNLPREGWKYVITEKCELDSVFSELNQKDHNMITIYLCEIKGEVYTLDLRNMSSIEIVGIGSPRITYFRNAEVVEINLDEKDIHLDNLIVKFNKDICLKYDKKPDNVQFIK